jgi:deazaflavin-dependent oxidoreductase (nitroreductase family)
MNTSPAVFERELSRALNQFIEPAVRSGCASPGVFPTGLIVLETRGRVTGQPRSVPLFAALIEDHVLVSTLRGNRSQWIRNLSVNPGVRYWLGGQAHDADALVFSASDAKPDLGGLPPAVRCAAESLGPAEALGWAFALLVPRAGAVS